MAGEPQNTSGPRVNPFIHYTATCPICGKTHDHLRIKSHLFIKQDRDIDLRPRKITVKEKGLEQIRLSWYSLWHCPACSFTFDYRNFEDPVRNADVSAREFQERILDASFENDTFRKIATILKDEIDEEHPDDFQTLKLHLLALLHLQQVPKLVDADALLPGKFALRLAWFYRELRDHLDPGNPVVTRIIELLRMLRRLWENLPGSEREAHLLAADYYQTAVTGSRSIRTDLDLVRLLLHIARIRIKLGQFREAMTLCSNARQLQMRFEAERRRLLALPSDAPNPPTDQQLSKMAASSRNMRYMLDQVLQIIDTLREDAENHEIAEAGNVLSKLQDIPFEEQREQLLSMGFRERVVARVLPAPKKKKLRDLFRP